MKKLYFALIIPMIFFSARGARAAEPPRNQASTYTGLIVDGAGLDLSASMSPKIYDDAGQIIYGNAQVPPGLIGEKGVAAYAQSLAEALSNPRIGANPLVVKAIRSQSPDGVFYTNLVVSGADAQTIMSENQKTHFLDHMNVIFVIAPPSDGQISPAPASTSAAAQEQNHSSLADRLGIDGDDWKAISKNAGLITKVEALPVDAISLYKNLSFFERVAFDRQLHGTTNAVVTIVDNKQAFITGNIMGHDVFQYMEAGAKSDFQNGKITAVQYQEDEARLETLSKLTPDQRSDLISLLDAEMQVRGIDTSN